MSQSSSPLAVPSSVQQKLRTIRRYQISHATIFAISITLAALLFVVTVAMLIDWCLTLYNADIRFLLSTLSIATCVGAFLVIGLKPFRNAFGWVQAACLADKQVGNLQERWTTVTELATVQSAAENERSGSRAQEQDPVYRAMLGQLTSESVALEKLVQPREVVPWRDAWKPVGVLGLAALLLAIVMVSNWPRTSVLWKRFWSFGGNVTATQVRSLSGDFEIPRGDWADIRIQTEGIQPDWVEVLVAKGSEEPETFRVKRDNEGEFMHSFASVEDDFSYRIRGGDGQTPWHRVAALDRPHLKSVKFVVDAPSYIKRPRYEKDHFPSRVKAMQGSELTIEVQPDMPVSRVELSLTATEKDGQKRTPQTISIEQSSDGLFRYRMTLLDHLLIQPTIISHDGLTDGDELACRIQVIEDKPPVARVIASEEEIEVDPGQTIDIQFEAHDDHGISKIELVVFKESGQPGEEPEILHVQEIPLGEQMLAKHVMDSTQLDLGQFDLDDIERLSYSIRVTDNRTLDMDHGEQQESSTKLAQRTSSEENREGKRSHEGGRDSEGEEIQNQSQSDDAERASAESSKLADAREPSQSTENQRDPENPVIADSKQTVESGDTGDAKPMAIDLAENDSQVPSDDSAETAMTGLADDLAESDEAMLTQQGPPFNELAEAPEVMEQREATNTDDAADSTTRTETTSLLAEQRESPSASPEGSRSVAMRENAETIPERSQNQALATSDQQLDTSELQVSLSDVQSNEKNPMLRRLLALGRSQGSNSNRMRLKIRDVESMDGQVFAEEKGGSVRHSFAAEADGWRTRSRSEPTNQGEREAR